jgi:murein DD-endopeptidase MepM/ murein hydrolase activator NlpD
MSSLNPDPNHRPHRRSPLRSVLVVVGLAVAAIVTLGVTRNPAPKLELTPAKPGIGRGGVEVQVVASEPSRGLSRVSVELTQNDKTVPLGDKTYSARPFWAFWGERTATDSFAVVLDRDGVKALKEGPATLRATAERAGGLFGRGEPTRVQVELPVLLRAPALAVASSQHYAAQGGAGVVVYRVGATALAAGGRDGVRAGDWFFRGYPLPGGGPEDRFALYGVPYDASDASSVKLVAADALGNETTTPFVDQFIPRPMKTDDIEVDDAFLSRVVPAILAETPSLTDKGDPLENYLQINRDLRKANNRTLVELAADSKPEILWRKTFQPMPNGQVMSAFADRRTYVYQGRNVDQQDHLGFDLASVKQAPVPSANDGVVVLARYHGIYGNTVVVDHGAGVMSLYSHLSSLAVSEGQAVTRGQEVGRTGVTGLAGGDHLHFTMLVGGLPVNPIEWWDAKWIRDRLVTKLGAALPFQD